MVRTLEHTFFSLGGHLVRKKTYLHDFFPKIWSVSVSGVSANYRGSSSRPLDPSFLPPMPSLMFDFIDIYVIGFSLLLVYVLKTYSQFRTLWKQYRSVYIPISFSKPATSSSVPLLARSPDDVRSSPNSTISQGFPRT